MSIDATADIATLVASHYALGAISRTEEASDNVIRATTPAGEIAIKLFSTAEVDRAEREAALLAHLGQHDPRYRVQQVIPTRSGAGALTTPFGAIVVTHWLHGAKKVFTTIPTSEWEALGTELAALHARLESFEMPMPRLAEHVVDVAAERARIVTDRVRAPGYAAYLDARLDLLERFAPAGLAPPPTVERPIHNDYNHHNYLFDGAMPPMILDWEGAIAAPHEYEVVRCMNHLPLVAREHATAFVTGYRSVRPLDPVALRWAVDRAFVEHAIKSWPLDRWFAGLPGAEERLSGSVEVTLALHARIPELEAFYGVAR